MELHSYPAAASFLAVAGDWLAAHEIEYNLLFGVARRLKDAPPDPTLTFMTVTDGGRLSAAAVMTPPYPLLLILENPAALPLLVEALQAEGRTVPGVNGPVDAAEAFSAAWCATTGQTAHISTRLRTYRLDVVIPARPVPGRFRPATEADTALLAEWITAFEREAIPDAPPQEALKRTAERIARGELFVWEDAGGQVVTLAGTTRPLLKCITIGPVYTPPEQRRKGYATACVAALSQRLLDAGWQHCTLFTDLDNPTSNSIYQQIGYRPVLDYRALRFEPPLAPPLAGA